MRSFWVAGGRRARRRPPSEAPFADVSSTGELDGLASSKRWSGQPAAEEKPLIAPTRELDWVKRIEPQQTAAAKLAEGAGFEHTARPACGKITRRAKFRFRRRANHL
jgi:hypothetical protein